MSPDADHLKFNLLCSLSERLTVFLPATDFSIDAAHEVRTALCCSVHFLLTVELQVKQEHSKSTDLHQGKSSPDTESVSGLWIRVTSTI